jgi:putative FmdB family regulatory protein
MPIYEYQCPKCGVMEVSQRITDDPLVKCPQCKRRKVKKLISNTSFQLKGSGWYVTDYGGKKTGDGAESGDSGGSAPADAASATAETKSETKSASKSEGGGAKEPAAKTKKDGGKAKAKAA